VQSSAELMFSTTLSLPAEFIRDAEPPAEHFLERLRRMDMPATWPLTYAEVTAKPAAALMEASHVYMWGPFHPWSHSAMALTEYWLSRPNFSRWRLVAARGS
jgi:hypothetical protein